MFDLISENLPTFISLIFILIFEVMNLVICLVRTKHQEIHLVSDNDEETEDDSEEQTSETETAALRTQIEETKANIDGILDVILKSLDNETK